MNETRPVCSVCIANYNGIGLIEACIESVLSQDWGKSLEIIVHDDASSDGSVDFIRSRYPAINLIESLDNVGFCVANNRMAAAAQGEFLLLLNNDAALMPDALRTLLAEARNLAHPAILGLPQYDADTGQLLDIGCLLDPFLNPVPNLDPMRSDVGMVMGACLWIPKTLWDELGGFPEWFGSIGEDLYLCSNARIKDYPILAIGKSGYRHHVGNSFGGGKVKDGKLSTTRQRRVLSERNKSYVMAICQPTPLFHIMLPLHLLLLIAEGVLISLLKRDSSIMRSIYFPVFSSLWREHRKLLAARHQCQNSRRTSLSKWLSAFSFFPYKLKMLVKYGMPQIR